MRGKLIALMVMVTLVFVALIGCSSDKPSKEKANGNSESVGKSGKVSLVVWGAEEDQELLSTIIADFENAYAGEAEFDITVEAESEATSKDMMLGDLLAGADVFAFVDDQLNAMAAAGALEKVADSEKIVTANSSSSIEAASIDGSLYAYPMTADNGYFMFYNKKYFSDEDVKTLDKMLEIAAKNNKKVSMDWSSAWYLYSFFGKTGLEIGLNPDGVTNHSNWNAAEGPIKGVDVAQAMLKIAGNPGFVSLTDPDFVKGMKDGRVIAGVSGVWNAVAAQEAWGDNYGAVKLPTYTVAGTQVQMASYAGYKMIGVNSYSKNKEWAAKLAEWITNEENQTLRFNVRGQGPSNNNAATSDSVMQSPAISALIQQSEFASLQRVGGNFWTPVSDFAAEILKGNPSGKNLQTLLDTMVEGITSQR